MKKKQTKNNHNKNIEGQGKNLIEALQYLDLNNKQIQPSQSQKKSAEPIFSKNVLKNEAKNELNKILKKLHEINI